MTAASSVEPLVGSLLPAPPPRSELRDHLVASRIAGDVATTRENNLHNFGLMSDRDPGYTFGLELEGRWSPADVLALMAQRCGVSPDPDHREGQDTIGVDLTLDALDRFADRLRLAAERRERVVVATGHPAGLFAVHVQVARALLAAGCSLLTPVPAESFEVARRGLAEDADLRYVGGVAMLHVGAELRHTHSPEPMRAILAALDDAGQRPDLVVADHGWAGAAGQAGVDSIGYADCNDPALFAGEAEGRVRVTVPLDDNVAPHLYAPMTAYLLDRAGFTDR